MNASTYIVASVPNCKTIQTFTKTQHEYLQTIIKQTKHMHTKNQLEKHYP